MTEKRLVRSLPGSPRDRATNGITCVSGDVGADAAAEIRESLLFAVQGSCECYDVAVRITDQNSHIRLPRKRPQRLIPIVPANASLGADAAPRRNAVPPPDAGE